jgi:hypothetical protein
MRNHGAFFCNLDFMEMMYDLLLPNRKDSVRVILYLTSWLLIPALGVFIILTLFNLIVKIDKEFLKYTLIVLNVIIGIYLTYILFHKAIKIIDSHKVIGTLTVSEKCCIIKKDSEVITVLFEDLERVRVKTPMGMSWVIPNAYSLMFVFNEGKPLEVPFIQPESNKIDLRKLLRSNQFLKENQIEVW